MTYHALRKQKRGSYCRAAENSGLELHPRNLYGRAEGAQKQTLWLHASTCLTRSSPLSILRIENLARNRNAAFPTRGVWWESSCKRQERDSLCVIVAKPIVRKSRRCYLSTLIMPWCVQERGTTEAKQDKTKTQLSLSTCQQENTANGWPQKRLWYQRKTRKIWKVLLGAHHNL